MQQPISIQLAVIQLNFSVPEAWLKPMFAGITGLALFQAGLVLLIVWAVDRLALTWFHRIGRRLAEQEPIPWPYALGRALFSPARLAGWAAACYLAIVLILSQAADVSVLAARLYAGRLLDGLLFVALLLGFFRASQVLKPHLGARIRASRNRWDDVLVPVAFRAAQVMAPLVAVILAAPLLGLPVAYDAILRKLTTLLIIAAVAWVLIQAVLITERAIIDSFAEADRDQIRIRSISTQISLLKRILVALISVFAVGCVLMTFDEVRRVGTSLLASAGLAGVVLGFAAQRVLGNLFAGIQIAFTQPIRLGDAVVVEGEWGTVEEITLTYVVIRVWDLRRLVLPISYFIEKPFQNWTRSSSSVIGSVLLFVDYTCDVAELRAEAKRLIEQSSSWDGQTWNLQVTDATERSLQVRILVSAANAGRAWDLRCEVRERLMHFLQAGSPERLPRLRTEVQRADAAGSCFKSAPSPPSETVRTSSVGTAG